MLNSKIYNYIDCIYANHGETQLFNNTAYLYSQTLNLHLYYGRFSQNKIEM